MNMKRSDIIFPGAIVQGLAKFYKEQGDASLPTLLEELGITEKQLWADDFKFDGNQALTFLRRMENLKSDTPVLEAMRFFSWSSTGVVGLAALSSANLKDAVEVGLRFGHVYMPAVRVDIENLEDRSIVHFTLMADFEEMNSRALELILCGFKKVGDEISGGMKGCSMHFAHACSTGMSDKKAAKVYGEAMDCEVVFNSDFTGLIIPSQYWLQPLTNPNQATRSMALDILKQQFPEYSQVRSLGQRVKKILKQAANHGMYLSLNELADILHVTPRTLIRKLSAEDLRFKDLLNDIRFEKAKQLLIKSDTPLADIAELVGFKDSNAFIRAFKRHSGTTPSSWRKKRT